MYRVETVGPDVDAAVDALPPELLAAFAELRTTFEVAPWDVGQPYVASTPFGSRTAIFGPADRGLVLYAVNDRERVVVLWQIVIAPDLEP